MRPVLEERAPVDEQPLQVLAPVARVAREQDVMLRPLDDRNAVDLHEAEPTHRIEDPARAVLRGRRALDRLEPVRHEQRVAHLAVRKVDHRASI